MAYSHEGFAFPMEHQSQANMFFPSTMSYVPYLQQHQPHPEMMYAHNPYSDYTDFMSLGLMADDFDEGAEVSTRPRLTKEQVEVLEAQFQAHSKPNSMVKKQLALQTKLTLPRVANWFQNRRAKAKQQRKQEEFELSQGTGVSGTWKNETTSTTREPSSVASSPERRPNTQEHRPQSTEPPSSPTKQSDHSKEASWASLQRALDAATAAQQARKVQDHTIGSLTMPPPELPRYNNSSLPTKPSQRAQTSSLSPSSEWSGIQSLNGLASPPIMPISGHVSDLGFDFGFDQDISSNSRSTTVGDSPETIDQHYVVSPQDWKTTFTTQTTSSQQTDYRSQTSPLPLPTYPQSRRGSGADELTANMGTFALAGTPPVAMTPLDYSSAAIRPTEGEIDIASRRKRPRPAALTSASLRSRSYGQLTSTSPAFRSGPPSGNALRHVKSMGHNLNSHYAGIRKSSLPQKSPLNLASFTEAESLKKLMAQQAVAAAAASKAPLTTPSRSDFHQTPLTQEFPGQANLQDEKHAMVLPSELLAQYRHMQSPPHTPFQPDYIMQSGALSMLPPSSARSQYANFPDYTHTPPYSAGPMTNSTCWSDAPLHSPDVTGFPSGHWMSSMVFAPQESSMSTWIRPSDNAIDVGLQQLGMPDENKKTEFFITEFPGQKEEYASIAQQGSQVKPRSYVFANTAPSDYDG